MKPVKDTKKTPASTATLANSRVVNKEKNEKAP